MPQVVHNHYHGSPSPPPVQQVQPLQHKLPPGHPLGMENSHAVAGKLPQWGPQQAGVHGNAATGSAAEGVASVPHAPPRSLSPGRRERYGARPRISASDIVPPERVAEDALRAARAEYRADVQRVKRKMMQDLGHS
jgi:hypothetical protein